MFEIQNSYMVLVYHPLCLLFILCIFFFFEKRKELGFINMLMEEIAQENLQLRKIFLGIFSQLQDLNILFSSQKNNFELT